MPYKSKKVVINKKKVYKKKPSRVATKTASTVRAIVKKELNKNLETKQANTSSNDDLPIPHNAFVNVDPGLLQISPGGGDPNGLSIAGRVGDSVNLKGVSIKMMLQLNERYSMATYRIIVVRTPRGELPTTANLFNGLSLNKMIDTLNYERYDILYQKYGTIRAGNFGGQTVSSGLLLGSGLYDVGGTNVNLYSQQTKIVKIWLSRQMLKQPIKTTYDGVLGGGPHNVKTYDYHCLVYAYSSFQTQQVGNFTVLSVNDYVKSIYFTDA